MHVLAGGTRLKTLPSRLGITELARLAADGARPAGPPPPPAGTSKAVEIERLVNGTGLVSLAGTQVSIGSELAGQRVTLRMDGTQMAVISHDGDLLRTLPCPVPPDQPRDPSLQGLRNAARKAPACELILILGRLRVRGWVWRLSMLWVVLGAGGPGYAFVCTMLGCTTNQCTNDELWFPLYNGEPGVIAAVGALAAGVWILLAVPLLVAGFVRLRGWRLRNWLRAAAWAGSWVAGFALMGLIVVAGWAWANGSGAPDVAWGELPICVAWVALGAVINQILSTPAHERDLPATSDRSSRQAIS